MEKNVIVSQIIKVKIDESKFDDAFMREFRETFYNFSLNDHIRHLAQLHARGIANNYSFIEGYGSPEEMGIEFEILNQCDTFEDQP